MAWLFAQMWALEMVAFLAGAVVTWLVFVRPAKAAATRAASALPSAWVPEPRPDPAEPVAPPSADPAPSAVRPAGPALAELDAHARHARRPR
jgi:hypothetical protein